MGLGTVQPINKLLLRIRFQVQCLLLPWIISFFSERLNFATTMLKLFGADLFYMLKFTQHKLVFQTKVASKRKWQQYPLNHGQITYTPSPQGSFVQLNKQQPCNGVERTTIISDTHQTENVRQFKQNKKQGKFSICFYYYR